MNQAPSLPGLARRGATRDMAVEAAADLSRAVAELPPAPTCSELDRQVQSMSTPEYAARILRYLLETGCYNLTCTGFVQIASSVIIGGGFTNYSTQGGTQYSISLAVVRDFSPPHNWWLKYGDTLVGYYPNSLFASQGLANYSDRIDFGGEIVNTWNGGVHTTTDMGSGGVSSEGFGAAAFTKKIKYWDTLSIQFDATGLNRDVTNAAYYDLSLGSSTDSSWLRYFYFGGPGRVADTTPPTISVFNVSPSRTTLSQSLAINYTVSDSGGSGLNHVVLRRTAGDGSALDPGWHDITTSPASGSGPVSGSFSDVPPSAGTYWYGMAVVDNAGNSKDERQAGVGPVQHTVTSICYTLSKGTNPGGVGSVTVNTTQDCTGGYAPNAGISLTANVPVGYTFTGWFGSGGSFSSPTSNPTTFTITANASVTATFTPICYTVSKGTSPGGVGSVTVNTTQNCSGGYTPNTSVSLTANTPAGYTFSGWSGSGGGFSSTTANPTTFTITGNSSVTATFTPICCTLSKGTSPAGVGGVTVNTTQNCSGGYTPNTSVSLTASTPVGYTFSGWSGSGGGFSSTTANPTTFTITGNASVTATFTPVNCLGLSTNVNPPGVGSVTVNPGSNCAGGGYSPSTSISLTANTPAGYTFVGWSGTGGSFSSTTANPTTFTITGNASVTALFTPVSCLGLNTNVNPPGVGSISVNTGSNCAGGGYSPSTSISLTANTPAGFTFTGWSGSGGTFSSTTANPTTFTITGNASVTATFTPVNCLGLNTNVNPPGVGSVTVNTGSNCAGGGYSPSTSVSLTANTPAGYTFVGWSGTGGTFSNTTANPTTFTITGNASVTATFTPVSCFGLNTSVSPAGVGSVTVNTGSNCAGGGYNPNTSISLTANTPAGYTFTGWSGSGGSFSSTTANPTTFTIVGSASVSANFSAAGTSLPNLTAYKPSGWSDKIVVSTAAGVTTDSSLLLPTDTLYVNWAAINDGGSSIPASPNYWFYLYLDGSLKGTWYVDFALDSGWYINVLDFSLGSLSQGTHTLRLVCDTTNVVRESNEGDNEYTKIVLVGAPALAPTPARFFPVAPCRLFDTRSTTGQDAAWPALAAGETRSFTATNTTCAVPSGAAAVSLNVTAADAKAKGHITIFPGTGMAPGTSSVSFNAGQNRANNVLVGLTGGVLSVTNTSSGTVNLVLDVNGYFK